MKFNISQFFQAAPNVFLFRHLPLSFSIRYLRLLGKFYYIANRRERRQIEENILSVFTGDDASAIVKKTFDGIFSHYAEKLLMAYRNLDVLKKEVGNAIEFSGLEYLEDAYRKNGVILFTGHFGAVEFLPMALHLCNYPVSIIVCFQTQKLKENLMLRAESGNVELIDGKSGDVLLKAMDALKRGRILLTECDEVDFWSTKSNKTVNAFGTKIKLDRSVEILCRRTGASVLGGFMIRTNKGYRLSIVPVVNNENGKKEISVNIIKIFENFVMRFPDQWYQWKKFHKMRPEVG